MRRICGTINFGVSIWLIAVVVLTIVTVQPCFSECEFDWKPGQNLPGLNGWVYAVTPWDPDGAGPQPELLVAGGYFNKAGGGDANGIAAWDGNSWLALGSGMSDPLVRALTVYNGQLIAGGYFTTAGGVDANYVAAWDGIKWQPLGSGMN